MQTSTKAFTKELEERVNVDTQYGKVLQGLAVDLQLTLIGPATPHRSLSSFSITIVETTIAVARSAFVSQADGSSMMLRLITYAISHHVFSELFLRPLKETQSNHLKQKQRVC